MDLEDLKRQVASAQLQAHVRDAQDGLTASQGDAQRKKDQELQSEIKKVIDNVNKQILARKGKQAIIFTFGGSCSTISRGIGKAVLNHVFDLFDQDSDIYLITEGRKHNYDSNYQKLTRGSSIFDCGQIAVQNRNRSPKVFNGSAGTINPSIINDLYH